MLEGHVVVRAPDGERRGRSRRHGVLPGRPRGRAQDDEPPGGAGAHRHPLDEDESCLAVYPDSDKIGIWPPGKLFRLGDAVDYWDGEL